MVIVAKSETVGEKLAVIFYFNGGKKSVFPDLCYGEIPSLPSVKNSFQTVIFLYSYLLSLQSTFGRTFSSFSFAPVC